MRECVTCPNILPIGCHHTKKYCDECRLKITAGQIRPVRSSRVCRKCKSESPVFGLRGFCVTCAHFENKYVACHIRLDVFNNSLKDFPSDPRLIPLAGYVCQMRFNVMRPGEPEWLSEKRTVVIVRVDRHHDSAIVFVTLAEQDQAISSPTEFSKQMML